jgi:hypothetical protein
LYFENGAGFNVMQSKRFILRAGAAFAALSACSGEPTMSQPSAAALPPLMWQQVTSVRVLCLVGPDVLPGRRELEAEICAKVRDLAAARAPVPVSTVGFGDPAVLEPETVTLLVHAAIQSEGDGRLLVFDIRTFRPGRPEAAELFGAAPRAVRIPVSGPAGPALDAALTAALAETLPSSQAK